MTTHRTNQTHRLRRFAASLLPLLLVLLTGCGSLVRFGKGVPTHRITIGEMPDIYSGRDAIYNLVYQYAWRPDVQRRTHLTTEWRQEPLGGRSRIVVNLFERGAGTYLVVMDVEFQERRAETGWTFAAVPVYVQEEARLLANDISSALGLW